MNPHSTATTRRTRHLAPLTLRWWVLILAVWSLSSRAWANTCTEGSVLFSEVALTPSDGAFIEVHNPTSDAVPLHPICITDASGANLLMCFPRGIDLGPGEHRTLSLGGSEAFEQVYGRAPDVEFSEDGFGADEVLDMQVYQRPSGDIVIPPGAAALRMFCSTRGGTIPMDSLYWGREASSGDDALPLGVQPPNQGTSWQRRVLTPAPRPDDETIRTQIMQDTWRTDRASPGGPLIDDSLVGVQLLVSPSPRVRDDGKVTYIARIWTQAEPVDDVTLFWTLPTGVVPERYVDAPSTSTLPGPAPSATAAGGPPGAEAGGIVWAGDLPADSSKVWILDATVDRSTVAVGPITSTLKANWANGSTAGAGTFTARTDADAADAVKRTVVATSRGTLGTFVRAFLPDDLPVTRDVNVGIEGRVRSQVKFGNRLKSKVSVYGLADATDFQRTAVLVEEAHLAWRLGPHQILVGATTLNTSRLDSFHPADVINARFLDTEIENPAKIGEPMAAIRLKIPKGSLSGYLMPWITAPKLASPRSRFSAAPGLLLGPSAFVTRDGTLTRNRLSLQWGVNLAQTYGPIDLSVQYLWHQDRTQLLVVEVEGEDAPVPVLLPVNHLGFNYNQALGSLVLKGAGAWRRFPVSETVEGIVGPVPNRDHVTVAAGLEATFGVSRLTMSILVEGQVVVLEGPDDVVLRQSLNPFQRDILAGLGLATNDRFDRSLSLLAIADLEQGNQTLAAVRYGQRLDERWSLAASIRTVLAPKVDPDAPILGLQALRDLDFANILLSRNF